MIFIILKCFNIVVIISEIINFDLIKFLTFYIGEINIAVILKRSLGFAAQNLISDAL